MDELDSLAGDWIILFRDLRKILVVGAIVAGIATLLWLNWFSPAVIVVFVAVVAMAWFALSRRPVADHELEQMLRRDEAESG